jgi:hypothetical protein
MLLWALLSPALAQSPTRPGLTPLFISDEPGRGPAFMVECSNTTGQTQSSGADVWPLIRSAIRLDGQALRDEGGRIGPGLTGPIQPGEKWVGIIELWQTAQQTARAVAFGAMVRSSVLEPVSRGRHTIAVRCDAQWSDTVVFFIEK